MMNIVFWKHKKKLVLKRIIFITLFLTLLTNPFFNHIENQKTSNKEILFYAQDPTNESNAPIITFIKPEISGIVITYNSYTIIANITDENPPLFGNVTFQISNLTNFLFNATMNYDGLNQWSFNWDNISLYPNQFYEGYIIRIWAIDSSTERNIGKSDDFYVYLNLPGNSPGLINVIIYLSVVVLIIAGLVVYMNKKLLPKSVDEKNKEKEV